MSTTTLLTQNPQRQLRPATTFQLETARLLIRPFNLNDAAEVKRHAGDFAVADTTLNVPHPYPDGAAEDFIKSEALGFARGESVAFGLFLKGDGSLVGCVGLTVTRRFNRGELGYWIARPYWNQGFATEAGRAVMDFGFKHWNLHRIEATYFGRNPASGRVMKKLGMEQEGILKDHILKWNRYEDLVVCGALNPSHLTAMSN